jgi:hypothetical protein
MNLSLTTILLGAGLLLLQLLAALPWVILSFLSRADWLALRRQPFAAWVLKRVGAALAVCIVAPVLFLTFVQDTSSLEIVGRLYSAILQTQLTVDLFILAFYLVLKIWPKAGAIALAAFLEGTRQWLFWLLTLVAALLMVISSSSATTRSCSLRCSSARWRPACPSARKSRDGRPLPL